MSIVSIIPLVFSGLFGIAATALWYSGEYWMFSAFCSILFALLAIYVDHATNK